MRGAMGGTAPVAQDYDYPAEADLLGTLLCGGLLLLVVVAVIVFVVSRSRRTDQRRGAYTAGGSPDRYARVPTEKLATDANALLVSTDDAVKTSEQELAFATAQYGEEATTEFGEALAQARSEVSAAFHLRQRLDDDEPEDEPTQRQLLIEIITHCRTANEALDAQAASFDALRDLESRVEAALAAATERRTEVAARLDAGQAALTAMAERWAASAYANVAGNVDQAQDRLEFAAEALESAGTAISRKDRAAAAVAVRGGEEAIEQAGSLLTAIDKAAGDLETARQAIDTTLAELAADLAAGKAAGETGSASGTALAAAAAKAEQVAASVREQVGAPDLDPLAALRRLQEARGELDHALSGVRDAAARAERARASLDQAMLTARASISAAEDFITTRRGAVGTRARTRLAEAQRHLVQAAGLQGTDPATALAHAQQAVALAEQANDAAQGDVAGWQTPTVGAPGGGLGGVAGVGGAVLGGILLDAVLRGGRRPRRAAAGSWGGRVPGGFGGVGSRARFGGRR